MIDQAVRAGDLDVGVAGGMESMSQAPYMLKDARFGYRMGDGKSLDVMINDGLTNPFTGKHMAHEASEVAEELEMTRPDLDSWALRSHELAIEATDNGHLPEEIVPVTISPKKGDTVVEVDEAPRRDTSLEGLAKLKPIFVKDGTHTAGNAPGVNDGAGAMVLASDEWAAQNGRKPLATIVTQAAVADDFSVPGAHARERDQGRAREGRPDRRRHRPVRDQRGVRLGRAELDPDARHRRGSKVNVNGGAIALGHPIGASGARILGSLIHELRRRGGGSGAPRSALAEARATRCRVARGESQKYRLQ